MKTKFFEKKYKYPFLTSGVLFLMTFPGLPTAAAQKAEVVSTQIDFDSVSMEPETTTVSNSDISYEEKEMVRVNQSLKNAIEENQQLLVEKEKITSEFKSLRTEHENIAGRFNSISQERDQLKKQLDEVNRTHEEQAKKVLDLQTTLESKSKEWENKIKKMEETLNLEQNWHKEMAALQTKQPGVKADVVPEPDLSGDPKVQGVLSKVSNLNNENEQLKTDTGKVHYNLGNIFFRQGNYEKAAHEYRQAVDLMPNDAQAHYNLAFVNGDYLNDQKEALKNYQRYLFLNPNASDIQFVKERILKAQMELKSAIDSPLNQASQINDNF